MTDNRLLMVPRLRSIIRHDVCSDWRNVVYVTHGRKVHGRVSTKVPGMDSSSRVVPLVLFSMDSVNLP